MHSSQISWLSKLLTRRENVSQKGITGQEFGSQKGITGRELGSQKSLPDKNWALKNHYRTRIGLSNIITGHEYGCQYLSIWKGLGESGRTLKVQGGSKRVLEGPGGSCRV